MVRLQTKASSKKVNIFIINENMFVFFKDAFVIPYYYTIITIL